MFHRLKYTLGCCATNSALKQKSYYAFARLSLVVHFTCIHHHISRFVYAVTHCRMICMLLFFFFLRSLHINPTFAFPFLSKFKQCSSYSSIVCIALVNVAPCYNRTQKIIRHSEIKRFFSFNHSPSRLLLSFCCTFFSTSLLNRSCFLVPSVCFVVLFEFFSLQSIVCANICVTVWGYACKTELKLVLV